MKATQYVLDIDEPSRLRKDNAKAILAKEAVIATPGGVIELDIERNAASHFQHPPIDFRKREIRLVRVIPTRGTSETSPITCEFRCATVEEACVEYVALSYTWGNANSEFEIRPIVLHGQQFWIRQNLWLFVQQARTDPRLQNDLYWIDSLCIVQGANDLKERQEKNHQVNIMGDIYENAKGVISWLGEPVPDMHPALSFLENCFLAGFPLQRSQSPLVPSISDEDRNMCHAAFRYLGYSAYWTRIWVIQEVAKAKKIRLRYGSFEFPWKRYWTLESFLEPHMD